MATQEEIDTLQLIVLEEQEAAKQEYRTPNIPRLDEIGFSVLQVGKVVVCDTLVTITLQKDEDNKIVDNNTRRNPAAIVGLFGGFTSFNVIPDGTSPDTVPTELIDKRVAFYLSDTYDTKKVHLCPVDISVLTDASSEEADNQRMRELLEVVQQPKVAISSLLDATFALQKPGRHIPRFNAILNAFVRPKDLFETVTFFGYLQKSFATGTYLNYTTHTTEYISDRHRFALATVTNKSEDTIILAEDAEADDALFPLDLMIRHIDDPNKLLPVKTIIGYVAANRLALPIPYNADLRKPLC